MKYGKPLPAERHIHAHPVTGVAKRVLQIAADAVEHLKFVGVLARCARSAAKRFTSSRIVFVVRRDRGIRPLR